MNAIMETIKLMPAKKKVALLLVLALSIAGMVLLFAWSQKPEYRVLFSNLAESDAGPIVQKLQEMKVDYKVDSGGILVPENKVYDLRLRLAAQGLPHGGGVGFELFDKTDFGTTDFVQKLNYRRAMQGELARTIMSLSEIEQCRVHLATPEKSLFVREEAKPSASVLLKLRQGRVLSQGQVQGIVHLVSSSVEGLSPKDVTVIDNKGDMLTQPTDDSVGLSSGQLEYQRSYEKEMESRVMGILEPVVGKSKIRAKVTANIDFTKVEKTEEKYDPDSAVVRSEQKNTEKSNSGSAGSAVGVTSNIPGKSASQGPGSQGQSQKQNDTINYEISKVTSHVINSSGGIKRLSVAVLVDGTYAALQGAKDKKYQPRAEEDLKRYEDLVKKAVGFTEERGDEVRVTNMQFEVPPQEELPEAPKQYMPYVNAAARYIIPVAAAALFLFFVLRPLMKTISAPSMGSQTPGLPFPQTVAELERAMQSKGMKALPAHEEVVEWARKNPDQAANVIKGWIGES